MPIFPGDERYSKDSKDGRGKILRDEDPIRTKALALLRKRGADVVDAEDQESPEFKKLLSEAIVEVSEDLVKRVKDSKEKKEKKSESEWGIGIAPWVLDDLGLLGKSDEEIEVALKAIEEEKKQKAAEDK